MLKEEALAKNVKVIIPEMRGPAWGVEVWSLGSAWQIHFWKASSLPVSWALPPASDAQNWRQPTTDSSFHLAGIHVSWGMVFGGSLNAPWSLLACSCYNWLLQPQKWRIHRGQRGYCGAPADICRWAPLMGILAAKSSWRIPWETPSFPA